MAKGPARLGRRRAQPCARAETLGHEAEAAQAGILLVNRSTALYSGMVPGLIAGLYQRDELALDFASSVTGPGLPLLKGNHGIEPSGQVSEAPQPACPPLRLAQPGYGGHQQTECRGIPIKPLETALAFLENEDPSDPETLRVIGTGAAGLEVVWRYAADGRYGPCSYNTALDSWMPAPRRACTGPASP